MRPATILLLAISLAGCGPSKEQKQAAADARAAGFVPPSVLSRLDYGSSIERRFHSLDRNADDAISAEEKPRSGGLLDTLDINKDGRITADEWSRGMLARFDRMDANHDGLLTSDERGGARAMPAG
jgi:hypothetical protein